MNNQSVSSIINERIKELKENKEGWAHGLDGALMNMIIVDELKYIKNRIIERNEK